MEHANNEILAEIRSLHTRLEVQEETQLAAVSALSDRLAKASSALSDRLAAVTTLSDRLEFVRKEILFEIRYAQPTGGESRVEPALVHPEKLNAMGPEVRVNLGAGHIGRPEYLNVDVRALDGIDLVAEVGSLPFDAGSLAEIFSAHLLEHFPVEELRRVLLPYWVSLLRPGGTFVAVVPDLETMVAEYSAGRLPFEDLREVLYGTQEYEGDFHFNGFSPGSLQSLFEESGLVDVELRVVGRRNNLCYEMEMAAVRPLSSASP
jgi:SAM-dependent methyltransferase